MFKTPVRPVNGKFVLSDAPGLGLELDEAELRKRTIPWTSSARGAGGGRTNVLWPDRPRPRHPRHR